MEDPIAKILARNSNLTKTQLETLLIDVLSENLASKRLKYEEKAKLRRTKARISRGAFNRTLRQAKKNTIQSIYTVILLGYFGIFEEANLITYIEIANKLKAYTKAYRDLLVNKEGAKEQFQALRALREELEAVLDDLSNPWITSDT